VQAQLSSNKAASAVGVAMGVAYGTDVFRKPLAATGRADYFGALPNLAARVMGQGHGGQAGAYTCLLFGST
jgi:class 3 adenylate cyclase